MLSSSESERDMITSRHVNFEQERERHVRKKGVSFN